MCYAQGPQRSEARALDPSVSSQAHRVYSKLQESDNYAIWQYWPQISSSLGDYFRKMLRFGAILVIVCIFLVLSVCIFGLFILFHSFNFVSFPRSRPLTRLNFYWLMLNWPFLLSFLLICEMKRRNMIMTVCKQAYMNLKLQTNKPLYLIGPQK